MQDYGEGGTVVDHGHGTEVVPGPGGQQQNTFVDVSQSILRYVATRWSAPEYLVSSDASNSNYASTVEAGAPWFKTIEASQGLFTKPTRQACELILKHAAAAGRFREHGIHDWDTLRRMVKVSVTPSEIESREPLEGTQRRQVLASSQVISLRTWREEEGYDPDEEQTRIQQEQAPTASSPLQALLSQSQGFQGGQGGQPPQGPQSPPNGPDGGDGSPQPPAPPSPAREVAEAQDRILALAAECGCAKCDVCDAAKKISEAAKQTDTKPTLAQRESGNYRKGRVRLNGLVIAIETPKGARREGVDAEGNGWSRKMRSHYGHILGTKGADGDPVDVFLGPHPESDLAVVIDQTDEDGEFDEHKVMLGWLSEKSALAAYRSHYPKGWKVGPHRAVSIPELREWLDKGVVAGESAKWDESKHPRDKDGKFTDKEGGGRPKEIDRFGLGRLPTGTEEVSMPDWIGAGSVRVHVNQTEAGIKRLLKRHGELRAIYDADDNLIVWPAGLANHDMVIEAYGLDRGDFYVGGSQTIFGKPGHIEAFFKYRDGNLNARQKDVERYLKRRELIPEDWSYSEHDGQTEKKVSPSIALHEHFSSHKIERAKRAANSIRRRLGQSQVAEWEFAVVPVADIVPSQTGEDYKNPSSEHTAKTMREVEKIYSSRGGLGRTYDTFDLDDLLDETGARAEDFLPITVDEDGKIIDGNHRHAAHVMNGYDEIPVFRPKASVTGESLAAEATADEEFEHLKKIADIANNAAQDIGDWIPEFDKLWEDGVKAGVSTDAMGKAWDTAYKKAKGLGSAPAPGNAGDLKSKILDSLQPAGDKEHWKSIGALGDAAGVQPGPSADPMSSKLNQTLKQLVDSGHLKVKDAGFGPPMFSVTDLPKIEAQNKAVKTLHQLAKAKALGAGFDVTEDEAVAFATKHGVGPEEIKSTLKAGTKEGHLAAIADASEHQDNKAKTKDYSAHVSGAKAVGASLGDLEKAMADGDKKYVLKKIQDIGYKQAVGDGFDAKAYDDLGEHWKDNNYGGFADINEAFSKGTALGNLELLGQQKAQGLHPDQSLYSSAAADAVKYGASDDEINAAYDAGQYSNVHTDDWKDLVGVAPSGLTARELNVHPDALDKANAWFDAATGAYQGDSKKQIDAIKAGKAAGLTDDELEEAMNAGQAQAGPGGSHGEIITPKGMTLEEEIDNAADAVDAAHAKKFSDDGDDEDEDPTGDLQYAKQVGFVKDDDEIEDIDGQVGLMNQQQQSAAAAVDAAAYELVDSGHSQDAQNGLAQAVTHAGNVGLSAKQIDALAKKGKTKAFSDTGKPMIAPGQNCGTGAGGFKVGNVCGSLAAHTKKVQNALGTANIAKLKAAGQWPSDFESMVESWPMHNPAAVGQAKKLALMEKYAAEGKWDEFAAVKTSKNTYGKQAAQAQSMVLAAKAAQDKQQAVDAKTDGEAKPINADGWLKIGGKLGTQPGGKYKDPATGTEAYIKKPGATQAKNEVLAAKLLEAAGGDVAKFDLYEKDGKLQVGSQWETGVKPDFSSKSVREQAQKDFAAHAWLANWDAIGAGSENPKANLLLKSDGTVPAVDMGGALIFSGTGSPKAADEFTDKANEWDTMRNKSINPTAGQVYGDMTPGQLKESAEKLKLATDDKIDALVAQYGPFANSDANDALATKLKARRDDILARAAAMKAKASSATMTAKVDIPAGAKNHTSIPPTPPTLPDKPDIPQSNKWAQAKIDKMFAAAAAHDIAGLEAIPTNATSKSTYTKLQHDTKQDLLAALKGGTPAPKAPPKTKPKIKVKAGDLPDVPVFQTSNAANKAANEKNIQELLDLAVQTSDLDAVKNATWGPDNKPYSQHPSDKVQKFHKGLVGTVDSILNPPPPPKPITGKSKVISDAVPIIQDIAGTPSTQKVGAWVVSGDLSSYGQQEVGKLPKWVPKKKEFDTFKKLWDKMPESGKSVIGQFKANNGSISMSFRNGTPNAAAKTLAKTMKQYSHELPEDVVLTRGIDLKAGAYGMGSGKAEFNSISPSELMGSVGKVLQDPAPMSSGHSGFNFSGQIKMRIRPMKGARGMLIHKVKGHAGEKEVLLPPNQRYWVQKVTKNAGKYILDMIMLPTIPEQFAQ